jgi:hypothetical protein
MDKLVQSMGITTLSKSQVSEMATELEAHVEQSAIDALMLTAVEVARSRSSPPTPSYSRSAKVAETSRSTLRSRPE